MPTDANGVPFDSSHIYASGNLAAGMDANTTAEATGRALASGPYGMTDDPGMKDMLQFLIARDTMHQQQWMAVVEELGGPKAFPIRQPPAVGGAPAVLVRVPRHHEGRHPPPQGRWTHGPSLDGKAEFRPRRRGPTARSRSSPRRARAAAPRPSRSTVPPAPWRTGPAAWPSRSWVLPRGRGPGDGRAAALRGQSRRDRPHPALSHPAGRERGREPSA